eukprot:COSAG01_NODE_3939_length_5514_cov_662.486057_10_plen_84_part_00
MSVPVVGRALQVACAEVPPPRPPPINRRQPGIIQRPVSWFHWRAAFSSPVSTIVRGRLGSSPVVLCRRGAASPAKWGAAPPPG